MITTIPNADKNSVVPIHPTIFVIFGITGDLAARKLLPALLALFVNKLLPSNFAIVGFSRRYFTREEFRDLIRSRINIKVGQFKEEDIKHFLDHMSYEQGNFDSVPAYSRLKERLNNIDDSWGQCSNKIFHLSVPPNLYEGILVNLASSKLTEPCDDLTGWTRILIEKPFGNDITTARLLDKLLGKLFKEEQIFRIDHYLAKEAIQNIIAFRFANNMFEPIWNKKHIEKVHIKLYEKNGAEGRSSYYDPIGALRDMGQSHALQMLSLIAMDEPKSFSAKDIRKERITVLKSLKKYSKADISKSVTRGQYVGYLSEQGVQHQSRTETYFRIMAFLNLAKWKSVPFFLESGKALYESKTEIDIYFRPKKETPENQNILTFRIQPEECIKIKFYVKTPGHTFVTEAKTLKFKYSDVPSFHFIPNDYERLLYDAVLGDQTLFTSTDEIMASWEFITSILLNWNDLPLRPYEKGSKEIDGE